MERLSLAFLSVSISPWRMVGHPRLAQFLVGSHRPHPNLLEARTRLSLRLN